MRCTDSFPSHRPCLHTCLHNPEKSLSLLLYTATPSVNQCAFNPSHGLSAKGCTPGSKTETCGELLSYCKSHGIHYQGYSPYGGAGGVGKLLGDPRLKKIAAAHGTGSSQVVLRWQWQLGISVNPEAQQLQYQEENLHFFNFTLSAAEMDVLNSWTTAL